MRKIIQNRGRHRLEAFVAKPRSCANNFFFFVNVVDVVCLSVADIQPQNAHYKQLYLIFVAVYYAYKITYVHTAFIATYECLQKVATSGVKCLEGITTLN